MNILEPEQFNSADFSIKLLNKEGKIKLKLVNKTGQLVFAKTPFLIAPFSFGSFTKSKKEKEKPNDTSGDGIYTDWVIDLKASCYDNLDLKNINNYDYSRNDEFIEKFFGELTNIENMLVDFAVENSEKLFKKKLKREIIEEAYIQKIVKRNTKTDPNTGKNYPDLITTKIMKKIDSETPDVVVEDFEGNKISVDSWAEIESKLIEMIPKGTATRSILFFRPYIVNGKLGVSIKLCALLFDQRKKTDMSNLFTFKSIEASLPETSSPSNTKMPPDEEVVDSDGEDVEVDEN